MEVIYSQNNFVKFKSSILTIGTFDGVHLAHQNILNNLTSRAKELNTKSIVVTFNPHPKHIVSNEQNIELLTSIDEKLKLFEKNNIDVVFVINFTKEFAKLEYYNFIKDYVVGNFNPIEIIAGYNHAFGKNREAGISELEKLSKEFNFKLNLVHQIKTENIKISSTEIRKNLINGEIETANLLLNEEFGFSGTVIRGEGRGRQLGFPTANLKLLEPLKLLPKNGIYIVKASLSNELYFGLMNIGVIPTFYEKHERRSEVYILDFTKDIYDEVLEVKVLHRLRDELKFNSVDELIIAMKQDEINGRNWLNLYQERNKNVNERTQTRIN